MAALHNNISNNITSKSYNATFHNKTSNNYINPTQPLCVIIIIIITLMPFLVLKIQQKYKKMCSYNKTLKLIMNWNLSILKHVPYRNKKLV